MAITAGPSSPACAVASSIGGAIVYRRSIRPRLSRRYQARARRKVRATPRRGGSRSPRCCTGSTTIRTACPPAAWPRVGPRARGRAQPDVATSTTIAPPDHGRIVRRSDRAARLDRSPCSTGPQPQARARRSRRRRRGRRRRAARRRDPQRRRPPPRPDRGLRRRSSAASFTRPGLFARLRRPENRFGADDGVGGPIRGRRAGARCRRRGARRPAARSTRRGRAARCRATAESEDAQAHGAHPRGEQRGRARPRRRATRPARRSTITSCPPNGADRGAQLGGGDAVDHAVHDEDRHAPVVLTQDDERLTRRSRQEHGAVNDVAPGMAGERACRRAPTAQVVPRERPM